MTGITSPQTNMQSVVKILRSMKSVELRNLYSSLDLPPSLAETATRDFIASRIIERAKVDDIVQKKEFVLKAVESYSRMSSGLERILGNLGKEEITEICRELGKEDLLQQDKAEIVERLVSDVSFDRIWKTKSFPKGRAIQKSIRTDLKRIGGEISAIRDHLKNSEKEHQESNSKSFSDVESKTEKALEELAHLSEQHERLLGILSMRNSPASSVFLEIFRKELVALQWTISPDNLDEFVDKVKSRLHVDEYSFTAKELEIALTNYLAKEIRKMGWSSDFQEFVDAVREEIPKIEIMPNQAEIPHLRERITSRLGINEAIFDKQLVEAWQQGHVSLHSGAPRAKDDVKYLEYEGNKYFYVSLR